MSTNALSSSLLSQITIFPSTANQFVTDLDLLAQDLQSGNLTAAQQDYVTLSQDALSGATSSTATTTASGITTSLLSGVESSSSSANAFVNDLNQLGTDLTNGNLASAEGDMLSVESVALNAAPSSSADTTSADTTSAVPSSAVPSTYNQADIAALIRATAQAMQAGDDYAIGADLSQLASISSSSSGSSYLQSISQNYGSSSDSSLSTLG